MDKTNDLKLDNVTIAKLAAAIAYATHLRQEGEVIGPTARKVLKYLDDFDSLDHVYEYEQRRR